jgi:hypothetical protein
MGDVEPAVVGQDHLFNFESLTLSHSIKPGAALDVTIPLQATQQGFFSGDVDVCTDGFAWTTVLVGIQVK